MALWHFISIRDKVLLDTNNLNFTKTHKLIDHFVGPYEVTEWIGPAAYHLILPDHMKIHDVYHIVLYKL